MGLFNKKKKENNTDIAKLPLTKNEIAEERDDEEIQYYQERVKFAKYQRKYLNEKNKKTNKAILVVLLILIGVLGLAVFSQIAYNIYSINQYLGYGVGGLLIVLFLILYIYCICYIASRPAFHNTYDEKKNKRKDSVRHNNKVRTELAMHIINLHENTTILKDPKVEYEPACNDIIAKLYGDVNPKDKLIKLDNTPSVIEDLSKDYIAHITNPKIKLSADRLAKSLNIDIAVNNLKYEIYNRSRINQKEVATSLQELMVKGGQIYVEAKKMIRNKAIECGLASAISQSKTVDAGIVAMMNMQLITDLVYLYGYRPNDMQMNRICLAVFRNVALAIGINDINVGSMFSKIFSNNANTIVNIVSNIVDSAMQLVVNGTLTILIGQQTVEYLLEEYEMQEILRLTDKDMENFYLDVVDLKKNLQADIIKGKETLKQEA